MTPKTPDINAISVEHGVAIAIIVALLPVLVFFLWRQIQSKGIFERLFEAQNHSIENLAHKTDKIKDDVLEIKLTLRGKFRTVGQEDE